MNKDDDEAERETIRELLSRQTLRYPELSLNEIERIFHETYDRVTAEMAETLEI